jgi:hypothetical protein
MDIAEVIARESIRITLTRYTIAGDRGRLDELARCFDEEAILDLEQGWVARGRREILDRTGEAMPDNRDEREFPLLRHTLSTQSIELISASEARAWTYFTAITEQGPDHMGRYIDRLHRVGSEWLIAHRRVVVEWYSPDTVYPEHSRLMMERRRSGGG